MKKLLLILFGVTVLMTSCTEQYSKGERIGVITRFSQKGLFFKTWEANLNVTQTGMNTSGDPFSFSVDKDNEDDNVIKLLDSAANYGWKVKVAYHECYGKNITGSRGETSYFIDDLVVLDRNFSEDLKFNQSSSNNSTTGKVIDTVYVIVVDKSRLK